MFDSEIGRPDQCIMSIAGIPIQRLTGVITNGNVISGKGFEGQLHELIHGVSGYEYNRALDTARTGDGMVSYAMLIQNSRVLHLNSLNMFHSTFQELVPLITPACRALYGTGS